MTDVAVTVGRRSDRVSISKKITRARNAPARWMDDPLSARPTRRGSSPKFFRPEDPPTGKASKASPKTPRASASYGGGGGAPPRRELRKKPSRALKTAGKIGDKKPIKGIYESREYRKPNVGYDLPVVGKKVLDVGAHIGWFTLWCLDHGASAVCSVEADPRNAALHAKNFANDDRVTSIHAAVVADEKEEFAMMSLAPRGETWRNSLERHTYYKNKDELDTVKVPCMTVPKLLKEHPTVHTVKIDIEGAEMEVLEAMEWPAHVKVLMFEYSCATRACTLDCPANIAKGCNKKCAKLRFFPIEASLKRQGFQVDYALSTGDVLKGKRPAIYDVVIFCKRANYQQ